MPALSRVGTEVHHWQPVLSEGRCSTVPLMLGVGWRTYLRFLSSMFLYHKWILSFSPMTSYWLQTFWSTLPEQKRYFSSCSTIAIGGIFAGAHISMGKEFPGCHRWPSNVFISCSTNLEPVGCFKSSLKKKSVVWTHAIALVQVMMFNFVTKEFLGICEETVELHTVWYVCCRIHR